MHPPTVIHADMHVTPSWETARAFLVFKAVLPTSPFDLEVWQALEGQPQDGKKGNLKTLLSRIPREELSEAMTGYSEHLQTAECQSELVKHGKCYKHIDRQVELQQKILIE
jgi:hypothetical protein